MKIPRGSIWKSNSWRKKGLSWKRTIAALDTDQTLAEAQRAIDEARAQLEPLARKFAVQRVAAFFLDTFVSGVSG